MTNEKTSKTERESYMPESLFGEHHYKTTISDGSRKVEGRGRTAGESEKCASKKW